MNGILIVAQKEMKQILKSLNVLFGGIIFVVIFGGMSALQALSQAGTGMILDQLGFSLVLVLGIFMGYMFSSSAFLREKQGGVIETLLCSPLSLRDLWLGKVIGVTVPAYGVTLIAAALLVGLANLLSGATLMPSLPVVVYIFTAVPVFIAAAVGLLGFGQLLLGLRENQIMNFGIIFALIFLITLTQGLLGPTFAVSWITVGGMFGLAVLLLFATRSLTRFLNRE
ncbi:MAG TPA: ABC transporter permease subunit, partial [Methanomicrobiales archaeon]|nr:ABC transporter permease subunit [Methanomicrobiales archaeon]